MTDQRSDPVFDDLSLDGAPPRPPARKSPWDPSSKRRSRTFGFAAAVLVLAAIGAGVIAAQPFLVKMQRRMGPPPTAAELKQRIEACQRTDDLACLKEDWTDYLKLRPDDGVAMANLGIVLNRLDEHEAAVAQFKHSIEVGEGTYDLFAYYAESLRHLGRTDEAIDWSYKALSVVPRLVDVRGSLAKLLVVRHRPYEALSLLESFDADAVATGHPEYFGGQRISIESSLASGGVVDASTAAASAPPASPESATLRLPAFEHHFYAPVSVPGSKQAAFMIDTGATITTVGSEWLAQSNAKYRVTQSLRVMKLADGRRIATQQIALDSLRVGPFELHDVPAVTCPQCVSLLGQSALTHFDLQSSRTQGVEFLTLKPRQGG